LHPGRDARAVHRNIETPSAAMPQPGHARPTGLPHARRQNATRGRLRAFGAVALVQFGRSVVDAGLQMERFDRQLQVATGSTQEAQRAMSFITAESNRLGQSIAAMVPAFTQLAAAIRSTVLEGEKTRSLFSAIVGAGQAVGLSTEAVGRAMTGLIQIISQNAIQLDEFRNQFASQIPGAMRETARALGLTTSQLLEQISKQKISVDELLRGVMAGLQEIQRMAPDMSNSAEAAFQRFSNAVLQLKASIAQAGVLDFLKDGVDSLREWVFWAGRALNLRPPDQVRQLAELQGEMARLQQLRQQGLQEATERIETRGMAPEVAMRGVRAVEQEIEVVAEKIRQLEAQMRQSRAAADTADHERRQRLQEEAEALKAFDTQRQRQEAALKGAPDRLNAEAAAHAASFKQREADLKAFYDEQRRLAEGFAQQELARAPRDAERIGEERLTALRQLAEREAADLTKIRVAAADQQLQDQLKVINAEIASAQGATDKISGLEARKTTAVAEHAARVADIRAGLDDTQIKESGHTTEEEIKNLQRIQQVEEDIREKAFQQAVDQTTRRREEVERLEEECLRRQEEADRDFADRVTTRIAGIFEDLLSGNLNLLETFRQLFLSTLAHIAAEAIARPIIVPIVASVIGGIAGALSPALG
jgi:tape measure domain-containing protein